MTDKQIIIDDCIHLDEWKHCDICEKLIKTKDGANGKKREHLLIEEDLRCDFYPNCYYKQLKYLEKAFDYRENTYTTNLNNLANEAKFLREKLQIKEQECEELKKQLVEMISQSALLPKFFGLTADEITNMLKQLDQLKVENKKLEKANNTLHNDLFEIKQKIKQYKEDSEAYKKCYKNNLKNLRDAEFNLTKLADKYMKFEKTLEEIIKFFKEDEKFARYSGCPVVLTKTALEKIEKILKENDIKINEVIDE